MKIPRLKTRPRYISLLSVVVLLGLAFMTIGLSWVANSAVHQKLDDQYENDTQVITDRVSTSLNSYANILYSGRAFILNSQVVYPSEWIGFYNNQDIFNRYKGVSAINYIKVVNVADKARFVAEQRKIPGVSPNFSVLPVDDKSDVLGVATLTASRIGTKLTGSNVFRTPERLAVYKQAELTGLPIASGLTDFSTGAKGIFVAMPVSRNGATEGYVNVVIYSNEFFPSVVSPKDFYVSAIQISDITDPTKTQNYYQSPNWGSSPSDLNRSDKISFGGRQWLIEYRAPTHYRQGLVPLALPLMILLIGILLIMILAICFYILLHSSSRRRSKHIGDRE